MNVGKARFYRVNAAQPPADPLVYAAERIVIEAAFLRLALFAERKPVFPYRSRTLLHLKQPRRLLRLHQDAQRRLRSVEGFRNIQQKRRCEEARADAIIRIIQQRSELRGKLRIQCLRHKAECKGQYVCPHQMLRQMPRR